MGRDIAGFARKIGGPDRFVRFLRVLGGAAVNPRRVGQVTRSELAADQLASRGDRFGRDRHTVGSHIGDEPHCLTGELDALVEPLRDLHRPVGRQPELAGRLLLQGRGRKGRERVAADLPAVDLGDRKARCSQDRVCGRPRLGLAVEIEALEALAVEVGQPRRKGLAGFCLELDFDGPVFAGLERLDFGFPLADQAQRDGLDAAGRAAAWKLAPQHRRQREADEVIERAAGEIGLDQLAVDLARASERIEHRVLGHLVKDHPLDVEML